MDLLLIDGPNLAHRAHHATGGLSRSDGVPSGAVFGFTSMLARLLDDHRPRHFVVAWEGVQSTQWRKSMHPGYKAHRGAHPLELSEQMADLDRLVRLLGGVSLGLGGAEADDVIATLVRQGVERAWQVGVVSTDKDLFALLRPGVLLLRPAKGGGLEFWKRPRFEDKYEISPEQWRVRTALAGDNSDGIPGVKGVGEMTALRLIKEYGELDNIYAHIDDILPERCGRLLREGRDNAYMSYEVARMIDDLPLDLDELLAATSPADPVAVQEYAQRWELSSLTKLLASAARLSHTSNES
jgi:DNA polymerase-1